jgi:ANTAR domain
MADRSLIRNRPGLGRGRAPEGRRVLDLAEGILIGLRRYSAEAAFDELVSVARHHEIAMSAAASALVDLATGDVGTDNGRPVEIAIAQHEWGDLLKSNRASNGRG